MDYYIFLPLIVGTTEKLILLIISTFSIQLFYNYIIIFYLLCIFIYLIIYLLFFLIELLTTG